MHTPLLWLVPWEKKILPLHFSTYFDRPVHNMFLVGNKHLLFDPLGKKIYSSFWFALESPGRLKQQHFNSVTAVYINKTRVQAKKKKNLEAKDRTKMQTKYTNRHTYTETKTILVKRANLLLSLLSNVVLNILDFLKSVHFKYLKIIQILQRTNFYRPTFRRCLYKNLTIHGSNAQD